MTAGLSNRGSVTEAERRADAVVVEARQAAADLLGADPAGIVFGRSMTALTFDFARTLARTWSRGDEIVVSHARPRRERPALGARRRRRPAPIVRFADVRPGAPGS